MGGISTFDFVPADYKIKYIDSTTPGFYSSDDSYTGFKGIKTYKVLISKGIVETFEADFSNAELTVGWLLSEVTRRYGQLYKKKILEDSGEESDKKLIIGLRTVEATPALDYYLTHLEYSMSTVKESTLLTIHFSNAKESTSTEKINKDSFQYLKVIGCGGYSNVVLGRKKDSGRLYAIKIIKKDKVYCKTNKNIYLNEAGIMKKLSGLPFLTNLHYTFQTENELYFAMDPCIGGTLFRFMTH
jgi:hypothetical protein